MLIDKPVLQASCSLITRIRILPILNKQSALGEDSEQTI